LRLIATTTIVIASLMVLPVLGAAADEPDNPATVNPFMADQIEAGVEKPPYDGPTNVPDLDKTRQGGDTFASAVEIWYPTVHKLRHNRWLCQRL